MQEIIHTLLSHTLYFFLLVLGKVTYFTTLLPPLTLGPYILYDSMRRLDSVHVCHSLLGKGNSVLYLS